MSPPEYLRDFSGKITVVTGASRGIRAGRDRLTKSWTPTVSGTGVAARKGVLAVSGWDRPDHIEPVGVMAGASLLLCSRSPTESSGQVVCSLSLSKARNVATRGRDGVSL